MLDEEAELKQRLSMLMDSELSARDNPALIHKLESDQALQSVWSRYHLIGEVMRNRQTILADQDLARRVSTAIAEDSVVLTFPRKNSATEANWRHKAVSLALAASLATVAVLVGRSIHENTPNLQTLASHDAPVDTREGAATESLADAQFNDYLLAHNETAAMAGSAGMLPHVRLVSARVDR